MPSSGLLCRVALVRTDVSEELIAFVIRVTRFGDLGTTLALTRNQRKIRIAPRSHITETAFFIVTAVKTSDLS
jgi:hypothetical protein